MTLTEFLLARIAEDEAAARATDPANMMSGVAGLEVFQFFESYETVLGISPARVLAECAAKRRIVEELQVTIAGRYQGLARTPDGLLLYPNCLRALQLLALPYADHPDYREEWKP